MALRTLRLLVPVLWIVGAVPSALACRISDPPSADAMVARADLILRATAVDYSIAPSSNTRTTGVPETRVRFRVESVEKGTYTAPELILPGYLSNQDDWNDQAPPYPMVRRNGRSGSCYANTYRQGAQFLLVLRRTSGEIYTVNWYALGPVNEQLRSPNDPWLLWVREQLKARE